MLNRRQLRIKTLQTLYAHFQSNSEDLVGTENQLLSGLDRLYDLYIYQLSLLIEINNFAVKRIEGGKKKYFPTEEDLNPNTKFVDNRFIARLRSNADFRRKEELLKIDWKPESEMIRKIYTDFRTKDYYKEYMENPKDDFKEDKEILIKIVMEQLTNHDLLRSYFEEIQSMWSEDYYMALALVHNTLTDTKPSWGPADKLPGLFKQDIDHFSNNQDKKFLVELVRKTILHADKYDAIIQEKAKNWEFDRIAVMDIILLRMGMVEIFEFPTIPLKVSLNEVIELAKHFSSPKSKVFINGLLDKTIEEGLKDKSIVKVGRGLVG